ncbi:MAG: alpha-L-fucosidase [Acidobacteriaceae bacterium]|nr:alpha-L-fucosidase [Acidobacteriaceae bacterium]
MRIKDLVDQHQPDLLYTDGALPFEEYGLSLVAHHYNLSANRNSGTTQAIYNSKRLEDADRGISVLDVERGIVETIWPRAWQTDTCIGDWHYKRGITYKSPKRVIDLLVDTVSRNGNLLLNFPLPASGQLDLEERYILAEITKWMGINGEAIHGTRPWKIFGESSEPTGKAPSGETAFNERNRSDLTASDVRFTTKGNNVYAFVMGWTEQDIVIRSLAQDAYLRAGKISNVELLGFEAKLEWWQDAQGLRIKLPPQKPCDYAAVFRIRGV